jgi:hypothetical protein
MTKFALSDILPGHCGNFINISPVVMLGFWLCQFNTGSFAWGLCLSSRIKFVVSIQCRLPLVMFVVSIWLGVVCAFLRMVGQAFCYLSVSHFFVPQFGVSAWHLKCTKHMGTNSYVFQ